MERKKSKLIIIYITIWLCLLNITLIQCAWLHRLNYLSILSLHEPSNVLLLTSICVFFAIRDAEHDMATVAVLLCWLCLLFSVFTGIYTVILCGFAFYMIVHCPGKILCCIGTFVYVACGSIAAFGVAAFITTILSAVGFVLFLTHEWWTSVKIL